MIVPGELYRFEIELSDVDRGVYDTQSLRVACHPSETAPFLLCRVLAYALHFAEGIGLSAGLCLPDEPAVFVRDLEGTLRLWVEVGQPSAERLHRATRSGAEVFVYTYKDPAVLMQQLERERIHRREEVAIVAVPPAFLSALAALTERRNQWSLVRQDDYVVLSVGGQSLEAPLPRLALTSP
ncbi:MAG: YaeQ family protein [Myxococcota bacterium]